MFRRDHTYAALDYGNSGGGHGHPDRLNLLLADRHTRWLDDFGTGSYVDPSLRGTGVSTASQTAWALMGLLAAGEARTKAVQRGIEYLLRTQTAEGSWYEPEFTGTGFPKYFFIKYHMYQHYFPLMALARYRQSLLDV